MPYALDWILTHHSHCFLLTGHCCFDLKSLRLCWRDNCPMLNEVTAMQNWKIGEGIHFECITRKGCHKWQTWRWINYNYKNWWVQAIAFRELRNNDFAQHCIIPLWWTRGYEFLYHFAAWRDSHAQWFWDVNRDLVNFCRLWKHRMR